jgi:hypothetical protein
MSTESSGFNMMKFPFMERLLPLASTSIVDRPSPSSISTLMISFRRNVMLAVRSPVCSQTPWSTAPQGRMAPPWEENHGK